MNLLRIVGKEKVKDTTLIRHAYVAEAHQRKGIGSQLLVFIEKNVDTEFLLVGTWRSATWAIAFYKKHWLSVFIGKRRGTASEILEYSG